MAVGRLVVFLMVIGVTSLQLQNSEAQTTHVVLDSSGWTIPQSGASAYTTWASGKTFAVGDVLVFNFTTGAHTVAETTKTAFDGCTTTGPIALWSTGPARVTLNSSGQHYYICTVPSHCSLGQKLSITVTGAASTPPPAPTPTATPLPSPTPLPAAATPPPASSPSPVSTPPPAAAPSPTATPPPSSTPSSPSPASTPPPTSNNVPSALSPAGGVAPPPPDSAATFAMAALPVTVLSLVMTLFY